MSDFSQVSVVVTSDREHGVRESIRLIQPPSLDDLDVMIKPNFNTADPAPGSTHNDTLIALIEETRKLGANSITVGERSGPPVTREVMKEKGIPALCQEMDASLVDFDSLPPEEWIHFSTAGLHWEDGFHVPAPLLKAGAVVATACLKTHGFGGVFSMALKLAVGICEKLEYGYMKQLHSSPHMRKMIAELNLAYDPTFTVLDGVDVFTDGGPAKGTHQKGNIILCSRDRVALDAAGVAVLKLLGSNDDIMSKPIFDQDQIARAAELGLGASDPGQIKLVPANDPKSEEMTGRLSDILK